MRRAIELSLLAFALAMSNAGAAAASTITVESGGIVSLQSDTGNAGTASDPWIITEEMTSEGTLRFSEGPLVDNGLPADTEDDDAGTFHFQSKWISLEVTNKTGFSWNSFRLALPLIPGAQAANLDGVSFASGWPDPPATPPFSSSAFSSFTRTLDTFADYLTFYVGVVAPDEGVTFKFVISDNQQNASFLLGQAPMPVPEPTTFALLGTALLLLSVGRRLSRHASHRRRIRQPARQP